MFNIGYDKLALMFMMGSKGISALSDSAQAKADLSTGTYNRNILNNRAYTSKIQQQWAYYNMEVIKEQAKIKKRQLKKEFARQKSDIRTTKGISSTSPTLLAIIEESAQEYLYDRALIDWDAELQILSEKRSAWAKGMEAESNKQDAKWQEYISKINTRRNSSNTWGSLLTGGTEMFSMLGNMKGSTPQYASSISNPRFGG